MQQPKESQEAYLKIDDEAKRIFENSKMGCGPW